MSKNTFDNKLKDSKEKQINNKDENSDSLTSAKIFIGGIPLDATRGKIYIFLKFRGNRRLSSKVW